ncbi:MAG: hypothetical protein IPI60_08815 [Saprospiraceae bacterium]|nr:hypothetical protein [Saprospiraceae bacterium]
MVVQIEVYSTNITTRKDAMRILKAFRLEFPAASLFFDLEDCDKIMRVVGSIDIIPMIPDWLKTFGFDCSILPD